MRPSVVNLGTDAKRMAQSLYTVSEDLNTKFSCMSKRGRGENYGAASVFVTEKESEASQDILLFLTQHRP